MHGPERNKLKKKILPKISLLLKPVLGKIFISISLFHNNLNDNLWPLYDNIFNINPNKGGGGWPPPPQASMRPPFLGR